MKRGRMITGVLVGLTAAALAACGAQPTAPAPVVAPAAIAPTVVAPTLMPLPVSQEIQLGVTGIGEVKTAQDANLSFQTQGTVAEVFVEEGATVQKGDLLAILDVRTFDQQLEQARAALTSAQAQEAALTEDPREADLNAARAGVAQAQAALDAVRRGPKAQDLQIAEAALTAAEANLQATRDRLSFGKTQAEIQVEQAAAALTQAQARFAQAKYNWQYAQDTGNDPIVPEVATAQGQRVPNKLSDGQLENYYAQFVQAEAGLRQAEKAVELAVKGAESARQAEITGVQAAETQVIQARLNLEKLRLPPDAAQLASARAALAQAQAQEARVVPDPRASQLAAARAGVEQAQAALTLAEINRERAELRAPFDGVISIVSIDPGDPSVTQGLPAIQIIDMSRLHVDVQISDVDISRVRLGQTATVTVSSLPGRDFTGKVDFVAPTATVVGVSRSYVVRIALDDISDLRAGMSARVDIQE